MTQMLRYLLRGQPTLLFMVVASLKPTETLGAERPAAE
jgi:hypothetical protein